MASRNYLKKKKNRNVHTTPDKMRYVEFREKESIVLGRGERKTEAVRLFSDEL